MHYATSPHRNLGPLASISRVAATAATQQHRHSRWSDWRSDTSGSFALCCHKPRVAWSSCRPWSARSAVWPPFFCTGSGGARVGRRTARLRRGSGAVAQERAFSFCKINHGFWERFARLADSGIAPDEALIRSGKEIDAALGIAVSGGWAPRLA
jgi:hypothetical protein